MARRPPGLAAIRRHLDRRDHSRRRGPGIYEQIEAVGNAGGAAVGDLIAVDGSGVR
ncbi:hypothetical protein [Streptomyces sp. NPDC093071]|uniref:hypothetical protein n=1 Tax=Streptomyces sp. NPDC093071 TaxID=3366022 RepID=UPI0037FFFF7D